MASRKNKWRRIGPFEVRRETARLHDGTPWGDNLWVRSAKVNGCRRVAWCSDHFEGRGAELGLGVYLPTTAKRGPVAIAKALRQYVKGN